MDKKYAIQGIIGCALFGVGDWLLGFVNPDTVEGDTFYFISAGHGASYADWKILVTMVCAVIGVLFFIIVIARGRTTLKKREVFFTPLTWILIIGLISMIMPVSAFSKGLYTFCMNGGMIVWFVREICRRFKNN